MGNGDLGESRTRGGKEMDFEMALDFEFGGDDKSHEVEIEPVIFVWARLRDLRG